MCDADTKKHVIGWFRDSSILKAFDMGDVTYTEFLRIIKQHLIESNLKPAKSHHCYINNFSCYKDAMNPMHIIITSKDDKPIIRQDVLYCPLCGEKA